MSGGEALLGGGLPGWSTFLGMAVLAAALRQATPILLGALAGLWCERSGVINIGIEGMMLASAWAGFGVYAAVGAAPGGALYGVLAAVGMGALMAALHAWLSVNLRVDQIISGTVINLLALGATGYLYRSGVTIPAKLPTWAVPGLSSLPVLGPLFRAGPITWLALLVVPLSHLVLFHSAWGQRVRAVGEHPAAAATAGIDPRRVRWQAVVLGGAIAGLAGAFLSLQAVGTFERGMSGGRGFIALAALIFGKWTPLGALGAALIFGYAQALQTQLQFAGVAVPHEFVGMLPYLLTILVLAGLVGRARPPAAIGRSWSPEGE